MPGHQRPSSGDARLDGAAASARLMAAALRRGRIGRRVSAGDEGKQGDAG